ncbi:hypothetical protein ACSSS7_008434 [Eimeria intestinalis]
MQGATTTTPEERLMQPLVYLHTPLHRVRCVAASRGSSSSSIRRLRAKGAVAAVGAAIPAAAEVSATAAAAVGAAASA